MSQVRAALGLRPEDIYRYRVSGALYELHLDGEAKAVQTCGRWRAAFRCTWSRALLSRVARCGRQVCPDCGEWESEAHTRRLDRVSRRLDWFASGAYLVFTVPPACRPALLERERLNAAMRAAWRVVEAVLAPKLGGVQSVHYFGDRRRTWLTYAPTIEVLLPGAWGFLSPAVLERLRGEWARALAEVIGVDVPVAVVNYRWKPTRGQWRHALRYVLRPTVSAARFLDLVDEAPELARQVAALTKRAHSVRYCGALNHRRWPETVETLRRLARRRFVPAWLVPPGREWDARPSPCPCACGFRRRFEYVGVLSIESEPGTYTEKLDGWREHHGDRAPPDT